MASIVSSKSSMKKLTQDLATAATPSPPETPSATTTKTGKRKRMEKEEADKEKATKKSKTTDGPSAEQATPTKKKKKQKATTPTATPTKNKPKPGLESMYYGSSDLEEEEEEEVDGVAIHYHPPKKQKSKTNTSVYDPSDFDDKVEETKPETPQRRPKTPTKTTTTAARKATTPSLHGYNIQKIVDYVRKPFSAFVDAKTGKHLSSTARHFWQLRSWILIRLYHSSSATAYHATATSDIATAPYTLTLAYIMSTLPLSISLRSSHVYIFTLYDRARKERAAQKERRQRESTQALREIPSQDEAPTLASGNTDRHRWQGQQHYKRIKKG